MVKKILIFSFYISIHIIYGQKNDNIIIGKIDRIYSEILNEERKLLVYVPQDNPYDKNSYPVIYLLDGDAHFYSVVGMVHQLSSINRNRILPKMIIVGISNTDRIRDLTPSKGKYENSGGGDDFILFIEKELIPYVDSNYSTMAYRTFIGHSLGGLTVMNVMYNKPELFNSYVAIDPSMWWNNRALLTEMKGETLDKRYSDRTLFLGYANTIRNEMDTLSVQKDTTYATRHIRAILELNSYLNNNNQNYLSFLSKYYENDDHGSVPLISEYDALRFIFDFYKFKLVDEDYSNPKIDIAEKVENYYERLSIGFGIEMKPGEEYVNDIGHRLLREEQFIKAKQVFELNIKNYPMNYNVYEAMGDFYSVIQSKDMAIENYKKAYSLNKNSFLINKVRELESGN